MTTKRKTNLAINLADALMIRAKKCVACGFTTHFKKGYFYEHSLGSLSQSFFHGRGGDLMVSPPGHRITGGLGLSLGWGECTGRNTLRIQVERFGGGGGGGGRHGKGGANLSYLTRGELVWG